MWVLLLSAGSVSYCPPSHHLTLHRSSVRSTCLAVCVSTRQPAPQHNIHPTRHPPPNSPLLPGLTASVLKIDQRRTWNSVRSYFCLLSTSAVTETRWRLVKMHLLRRPTGWPPPSPITIFQQGALGVARSPTTTTTTAASGTLIGLLMTEPSPIPPCWGLWYETCHHGSGSRGSASVWLIYYCSL